MMFSVQYKIRKFVSIWVFSVTSSRSSLLHLFLLAACLLADGPALGGGEYGFLFPTFRRNPDRFLQTIIQL